MPLPYLFTAGEFARAVEVNANFDYVMSLLGDASTPIRQILPGEFVGGNRNNVLFTGAADDGTVGRRFYQIGYNADYNIVGDSYKFERFFPNEGATAIRVGEDGFEVWGTAQTTGDLHGQMVRNFGVLAGEAIYLPPWMNIWTTWGDPGDIVGAKGIESYRLTFCKMQTPPFIFNNVSVSKSTEVKTATDFGVPSYAKAITVGAWITATNSSGAGMKFYQERADRDLRHGGIIHAALGNNGVGQRAGGQLFVPLGEGAYKGKFVIERTADFYNAVVYILGFWL